VNGDAQQGASIRVAGGRMLLALGLAALWEFLHAWLGADLFSSLSEILRRLAELAESGQLVRHGGVTLGEALGGFVLGLFAGVLLPFALHGSPRLERAFDPYIAAAMGVPKLALAPLLILWFGIGFVSKVLFVAMVVFFLIFFSTLAGLRSADPKLLAMTRVVGAGRWLQARYVLLPTAVPFVLASMKVALPRAISAAVVGEFLAADAGLGWYVQNSMAQADTAGVFTGVVVVTIVVIAINVALEAARRRVLDWREAGVSGF
jgi:NitT/TauT family transport system permease protein